MIQPVNGLEKLPNHYSRVGQVGTDHPNLAIRFVWFSFDRLENVALIMSDFVFLQKTKVLLAKS